MSEKKINQVVVKSEKQPEPVVFTLQDEELATENYECIGCSNSDYGS